MLAALDAGSLGAVVADGAVLKYMIKKAQAAGRYESLSVLPFEFEKQSYAFALPDHSPYVEKFNQAFLSVLEDPVWRKELVNYLGK
jgi:polar amino acid transport system substrate-binding protein